MLPPCSGDSRPMPWPETIVARSASDHTDDWPAWYAAARHEGPNITSRIAAALGRSWSLGAVLTSREDAEAKAAAWNGSEHGGQ